MKKLSIEKGSTNCGRQQSKKYMSLTYEEYNSDASLKDNSGYKGFLYCLVLSGIVAIINILTNNWLWNTMEHSVFLQIFLFTLSLYSGIRLVSKPKKRK